MNGLEVMAVQMERMLARIIVVKNYLDNIALVEDMSVGVVTIHQRISC